MKRGNFYYYHTMEELQQQEEQGISAKMRLLYDYRAPAGASSRWSPTSAQLQELQSLFYIGGLRTPTTAQISRITARLRAFGRIEGRNVFYWFQNQKARERKRRLELMQQQQQQKQSNPNDHNECIDKNVDNDYSNNNTNNNANAKININNDNCSDYSDSINSTSDNNNIINNNNNNNNYGNSSRSKVRSSSIVACCSTGSPASSAISPPSPSPATAPAVLFADSSPFHANCCMDRRSPATEMPVSLHADVGLAPGARQLQRPNYFVTDATAAINAAPAAPSLHQHSNYSKMISNYDISYDNAAPAAASYYNSSVINPDMSINKSIIKSSESSSVCNSSVFPLILFPLSPELQRDHNQSHSISNSCCVSHNHAQRRLSAGSPSANFSAPLLQLDLKLAIDH